jgi:hypothetical protein
MFKVENEQYQQYRNAVSTSAVNGGAETPLDTDGFRATWSFMSARSQRSANGQECMSSGTILTFVFSVASRRIIENVLWQVDAS